MKTTLLLALIFFCRMFPLFIILPVLMLEVDRYQMATPELMGIALGVYGITQAILQSPFGILSDRFGRKPIILIGLALFAFGSLVAASADTVMELIIGRALQGCGAIASAILSLAADLTTPQKRTRTMAVIGSSIGLAFCIALVMGPVLYAHPYIGIERLFLIGVIFACLAATILLVFIPESKNPLPKDNQTKGTLQQENPSLFWLYLSILLSHLLLMANFTVLPIALNEVGFETSAHWQFYLGVLSLSLFIMVPTIIFNERSNCPRLFIGLQFGIFSLAYIGMMLQMDSLPILFLCMILFFAAFNYLEAALPSEVAKTAPLESRGKAMGIYSSCQFIGMFLGGAIGGYCQKFGLHSVPALGGLLCIIWLLSSIRYIKSA